MHYAGIHVRARPGGIDAAVTALGSVPGIEVHYTYPESGRIIVVHESETLADQEEGLREVQALDQVVQAELVYHRVDEETEEES